MFYEGRKVLITGGAGMIGSHLAEMLMDEGAHVRITEHNIKARDVFSKKYLSKMEIVNANLTNYQDCMKSLKGVDYVFQLAASLTGVMGNIATPVRMFTPNVLIQTNMIEAAHNQNISGYLFVSSACVYSSEFPVPYKEEVGLLGQPDANNEAHAWAKRMGELQAKYYYKEYGMKIGVVRPFNSYGPRDNFHSKSSHVVAGLIQRAARKEKAFVIWGNGNATRDFVYVTDTARAMMETLEKRPEADPINIASGREVSIRELAETILRIVYGPKTPKIVYDSTKPIGQDRRSGSTEKARKLIGFKSQVSLEEGLRKTVDWYMANMAKAKKYEI